MDYRHKYLKYKKKYYLLKGGTNSEYHEQFNLHKKFNKCKTKEKLIKSIKKGLERYGSEFKEEINGILHFEYKDEFVFTVEIQELDDKFQIIYTSSNREHLYNTLIITIIQRICFEKKKLPTNTITNLNQSLNHLGKINNKLNEHKNKEYNFSNDINLKRNDIRKIKTFKEQDSGYLKLNIEEIISLIQRIFDYGMITQTGGGKSELYHIRTLLNKLYELDLPEEIKEIIKFYKDFFNDNQNRININVIETIGEQSKEIYKTFLDHLQMMILENTNISIDNIVSDNDTLEKFIIIVQIIYSKTDIIDASTFKQIKEFLNIINVVKYKIRHDLFHYRILEFYQNALLNKILEYSNYTEIEFNVPENINNTTKDIYPEKEDTIKKPIFNPMNRTEKNFGEQYIQDNPLSKTTKI